MKRYRIQKVNPCCDEPAVTKAAHGAFVLYDDAVAQCAWCDDTQAIGKLQADLLATRRALKMAQAKALNHLAETFVQDAVAGYWAPNPRLRAARLCQHWRKKFEREAAEL